MAFSTSEEPNEQPLQVAFAYPTIPLGNLIYSAKLRALGGLCASKSAENPKGALLLPQAISEEPEEEEDEVAGMIRSLSPSKPLRKQKRRESE
jgi:hypothetical protein